MGEPAKVHDLKCWPDPFDAMADGRKPYEIRVNDRDYRVGDMLVLRRWAPCTVDCVHAAPKAGHYDGPVLRRLVTYMTPGGQWGLPENLCVLGVREMDGTEMTARARLPPTPETGGGR